MKTFALGLLTTFGAVGGIENSVDNVQLIQCCMIAVVGTVIMWAGTDMIKHG